MVREKAYYTLSQASEVLQISEATIRRAKILFGGDVIE